MAEAPPVIIHQSIHGYLRGHTRLASSGLGKEEQAVVDSFSDINGYLPNGKASFKPYYQGFPVGLAHYALTCTWPDRAAPREGAVHTHALLLPVAYAASLPDLRQLLPLFRVPVRGEYDAYTQLLAPPPPMRLSPMGAAPLKLLSALACGPKPVCWLGQDPDVIFPTWNALTSAARAAFSFCTYSLGLRRFDLLFVTPGTEWSHHNQKRAGQWIHPTLPC